MLDFTLEERIKLNKEILNLLEKTDYEVINGAVKVLEGTNAKFILPVSNHSIQNMNQLGHILKHDLRLEEYNNVSYFYFIYGNPILLPNIFFF